MRPNRHLFIRDAAQIERCAVILDLSTTSHRVNELLAMWVRDEFVLDLYVDFPQSNEYVIGDPVGHRYESMFVEIGNAALDVADHLAEYMIGTASELGYEVGLATLPFAALQNHHDSYADD